MSDEKLDRIEKHILRFESKFDKIAEDGCAFGRATAEKAGRNASWIRAGIIGLISVSVGATVSLGIWVIKWQTVAQAATTVISP